jgi:hypothetical protein
MSLSFVSSSVRRALGSVTAVVAAVTAALPGSAAAVGSRETADADWWCRQCVVRAAGPAADRNTVFVLLHDPSGDLAQDTWFDAKKNPDQILAVAMAAITFRKTVDVNVVGKEPNSEIDRMYLWK